MKRVVVVAPGRPIELDLVEKVSALVKEAGADLDIHFDDLSFVKNGHFAGSDEDRTKVLQSALSGKIYESVWLARGGYGTGRLLSGINWRAIDKNVGVYGYSDGCFLHAALFRIGSMSLYHAPMPIDLGRSDNWGHMKSVVKHIAAGTHEKTLSARFLRGTQAIYERVYVSNLTVLTKLIGTKYEPRLRNALLIVEDVAEHEYAIDRMFFQLSNSRIGRSIAGVGIGTFSSMPQNDVKFNDSFPDMLARWFPRINLYDNIRIGHIPHSSFVKLGSEVRLEEC